MYTPFCGNNTLMAARYIQPDMCLATASLIKPHSFMVNKWKYIVACQRGRVSNEPPRAATRHGARDHLVRPQVDQTYTSKPLKISNLGNHLDTNFKRTNRTPDSPYFLLRQGEPGTSQYLALYSDTALRESHKSTSELVAQPQCI